MIRPNEFRAYFTLFGDFDPAEITVNLGITPTDCWKKGERNEVSHFERKFSRWSLESRLPKSQPIVEHIRDVLKQLEAHQVAVRKLRENIEGCMQSVAYFYSDSPWFHFDEDVVAGCATMNLSIDCDFYTMYSDRREDS